MGSSDTIKINVTIAGRSYPLIINADEKNRVIQLIESMNVKISEYRSKYSNKDTQDHLAMALLTTYNELEKIRDSSSESLAIDKLNSVEGQLDQLLG
jgi:cell division protein ZapA